MLTRRKLLEAGAITVLFSGAGRTAAKAQQAHDALVRAALDAGQNQVVIAGGTGAYGDRVKTYFLAPFEAETGIRVVQAGGSYGEKLAKLKAMSTVGQIEWDVMTLSVDMLTEANGAFFQDLGDECAALPNIVKDGIAGACVRQGVLFDVGGAVLAYDENAFKGQPRPPATWADFWDVERFPGPRALPNAGTPWWNLTAALIADGVEPKDLFPLDLDRAFRKLDEIKPHIAAWWSSGDQSQQIFRSGEVVMAMLYSGRAISLKTQGFPLGISWKDAPMDASFWGVLAQAPRPLAGLALLNYIYSRPQAHADYMTESLGATGVKSAQDLLPPAIVDQLPTTPATWAGVIPTDRVWLGANQEAVLSRWTAWLAS